MKIEYQMETQVSRYRTINDALNAVYGGKEREPQNDTHRVDLVSALMYGTLHVPKTPVEVDSRGDGAIETVRRQVLSREYEGDMKYNRMLSYVTLNRAWGIRELYRALDDRGYVPAGMSECTAYLKLLCSRSIAIGTVFHAGTHYVNELGEVQKLLVDSSGRLALVTMFESTKIRESWHIVVAQKEKAVSAASVAFGRKK